MRHNRPKPIGRSRTSCPVTYIGIFDRVRKMFAETPEATARGFSPGMFSVNSEGKCSTCNGDGVIHYHVGFGNFIDVDCETCGTTGFTPESMTISVDGKNIRNILEMSITEAIDYFKEKDKINYHILCKNLWTTAILLSLQSMTRLYYPTVITL